MIFLIISMVAMEFVVPLWGVITEVKTDIVVIHQNPELPQGCEITSLAILLGHYGYDIDKMDLAENYLPMQNDIGNVNPYEYYVGDPKNVGWYCFPAPIVEAANTYLNEHNSSHTARDVTGITQHDIEVYLKNGTPIITWVTLSYQDPVVSMTESWSFDGNRYVPYTNLHCVVVYGYNDKNIYVADPLGVLEQVPTADFMSSFELMGQHAVILE